MIIRSKGESSARAINTSQRRSTKTQNAHKREASRLAIQPRSQTDDILVNKSMMQRIVPRRRRRRGTTICTELLDITIQVLLTSDFVRRALVNRRLAIPKCIG